MNWYLKGDGFSGESLHKDLHPTVKGEGNDKLLLNQHAVWAAGSNQDILSTDIDSATQGYSIKPTISTLAQ